MADSIKINLELADQAASKALQNFINMSGQADKNVQKIGDTGSNTFKEIGLHIGKATGMFDIFAGNIAANAVTGAFDLMMQASKKAFQVLIVDGVKSAQESEDALNSLNVALGQAGIYSKQTSEFFQNLGNEIQNVTTLDDDLVIKNAALIESMTHLDKNGLARATKAAVQLSAAFNIDLETASRNVAKATDGNTTALHKLGLDFQTTGTRAGTYENVLKSIERLNGSAESKMYTFSGSVAHVANSFDDLRKEFGLIVTQNPVVVDAINRVGQIMDDMAGQMGENRASITQLVGEGFVSIIRGSEFVVNAMDLMISSIRIAFNSLLSTVDNIALRILEPFTGLSDTIKEEFDRVKEQGDNAKAVIDKVFDKGSFNEVTVALHEVGNAAEAGLEKLKSGADSSGKAVKNATTKQAVYNDEMERASKEVDKYVASLAAQGDAVKTTYDRQLEELQLFYSSKEVADTTADETNYAMKIAREEQFTVSKKAILDKQFQNQIAYINQSKLSDETKDKARLEAESQYNLSAEKLSIEHAQKEKALKEQQRKYDEQMQEYKLNSTVSLFGALGKAAALGGKKNFEIVKAFNLAEAITAGFLSVQKALASGPPPWNAVAATAAGIAAAANVSQITSTKAPAYEQGGIIGGSSYTGDNLPVRVNSGEMIINRQQQTQLFKMANGDSNGSNVGLLQEIRELKQAILAQPIRVNVDGREIINVVRNGLASGRSLT